MTSLINIKHNATTSINTDTQPQRPKTQLMEKNKKQKRGTSSKITRVLHSGPYSRV